AIEFGAAVARVGDRRSGRGSGVWLARSSATPRWFLSRDRAPPSRLPPTSSSLLGPAALRAPPPILSSGRPLTGANAPLRGPPSPAGRSPRTFHRHLRGTPS